MTNKTIYSIFLAFILFISSSYAQLQNLSPELLKKLATQKGVSIEDYLKLQQTQSKSNLLGKTIAVPDTVYLSRPQRKIIDIVYVKAFFGRVGADRLQAFGYNVFNYLPSTFEPSVNIPVPSSYVIGPGDEIVITLWGETQIVQNITVTKEGNLYIPDVGLVNVRGLTFRQLKTKLTKVLSKSYSSIDATGKDRGSTHLNVSTGNLRTVKIYILGEVTTPGGYTLPSLSSSFTALYYSGGPTINGSFRNIKILRRGKTVGIVDLYDYLVKGDQSKDIRLEDEDIVFVPPVGKRVAITGAIFKPAIYELKENERLNDLIEFTGGLTFNAYFDRIPIERIIPFNERKNYKYNILNLDLKFASIDELNESQFQLSDGDVVNIQKVNARYENKVTITGDVKKPGVYELKEGMTVRDLVIAADSVYSDVFLPKAILTRILPNEKQKIISFNLGRALKGDPNNNLLLENRDSIIIYSHKTFYPDRSVRINGQVKAPGSFIRQEKMTLTKLIILAEGLTDIASFNNIEITRMDTVNPNIFSKNFTVSIKKDYWNTSEQNDFKLMDYDQVFIRKNPNIDTVTYITIKGEVKYPGTYTILHEEENISDFIKRAGGFKHTAYLDGIYVQRNNPILNRQQNGAFPDSIKALLVGQILFDTTIVKRFSGRIPVDWLEIEMDINSISNFVLAPGDQIIVSKDPKVVIVTGAVGLPSTVLYQDEADLDYYIAQAGGYTENAADGDEIVILPNGRKWDPSSNVSYSSEILSGSVIIVPISIKQQSNAWPIIRDVVTVISSAAVLALTIQQLGK
ncbi:MAG: SLBB domain-containing protein [Bacteroidetes bacterium]|nr:SLBB domain-containing protein [Bacteroidota bacterium]